MNNEINSKQNNIKTSTSCTNCNKCVKECPMQIDISKIFSTFNEYLKSNVKSEIDYNNSTKNAKASDCIFCAACESVCPHNISIIDELEKVVTIYE